MTDPVAEASLAQRRAAAPGISAWVSANAGSGKTRVLTTRVARLLLAGADPARILCLTYTKAAAAEMANRLSALLGGWALMPDDDLRDALAALADDIAPPVLDAAALAEARRLFAKALETPGGLKIQTIHAFCAATLRRFPLEAGIAPDFVELDDPARDRLAARALEAMARDAEAGACDALAGVAAHLGDEMLAGLVREVLARRALFADPPDPARLCVALGTTPAALGDDPLVAFWAGFDQTTAARAAAILNDGSRNDGWVGVPLARALAEDDPEALAGAVLTGKGERRDYAAGRSPVRATRTAHPWLAPWLESVADAWEPAAAAAAAITAANRALALNRFGHAFLARFAAEKRAEGALDFDDLIAHALALLEDPAVGPWVLFRLDGGINHILLDEAQDTSPAQWRLIRALSAEFHAGAGTRAGRTLFAVGDEKQSIYSFQGAAPALFGDTAKHFAERLAAAGDALVRVPLTVSFRSSPVILRAVDATFARAPEGLSSSGVVPMHASAYPGRPGRVDLWPILPPEAAAEPGPWFEPVDAPPPGDPRLRLARLIAAEIDRWLRTRVPLPGTDTPLGPGDILILVRRRDRLAAELVRDLKRRGIPVAGADRIRVADELAVRDLLALARFALTPADDLSLAALLRSPLCGLSEDDLFTLAHGRRTPLWQRLRAAPEHAPVASFLADMLDRADFLRPFEFFDHALGRHGGRQRLLARLGIEAEDAIDELLAQALSYEAEHTPSLEGFLDWLARAGVEIKREQDKAAGAVRVMTVHGAKGLEAPVVILPDTLPFRHGRTPQIVPLRDGHGEMAAWRGGGPLMPPAIADALAAADDADREESRRLLYVAMTRAERWLVVAGAGKPPKEAECWHGLVAAGLRDAHALSIPAPEGLPGAMLRLAEGADRPVPATVAEAAHAAALPDWALGPPPAAPARLRRVAASALGPETAPGVGTGAGQALALLRGTAIHTLLEHLPQVAPGDRPALAARLLAGLAPAHADLHGAWTDEALAVLALPDAASFFAPSALAEVALSCAAPGMRIAGRIDRLVVAADHVAAVDFKTDASPPPTAEAVPEAYLCQMAAYHAALAALYPGRALRVALLWTATPCLMPLPEALLSPARLERAAAVAGPFD